MCEWAAPLCYGTRTRGGRRGGESWRGEKDLQIGPSVIAKEEHTHTHTQGQVDSRWPYKYQRSEEGLSLKGWIKTTNMQTQFCTFSLERFSWIRVEYTQDTGLLILCVEVSLSCKLFIIEIELFLLPSACKRNLLATPGQTHVHTCPSLMIIQSVRWGRHSVKLIQMICIQTPRRLI